MPSLNDPNIKTKEVKKFKRESLRHWDFIDKDIIKSANTDEKVNQLGNIKETLSKPNSKHQVNKEISISKHQVTIKETLSKPNSKQFNEVLSKQQVNKIIEEKSYQIVFNEIMRLAGLQRKLLIYIVENCISIGDLQTTAITSENLTTVLNTNIHIAKTTTQRLIQKNLIKRNNGKKGKGGYLGFCITSHVKDAVIQMQKQLNNDERLREQLVNRLSKQNVNIEYTKEETTPSSSSSYINNKTTTTGNTSEILAPEWEDIDLSELRKRNIRFGREHLLQVFPFLNKYSALDFQESIDSFVYDFDNGKTPQFRIGPLNFLLGIYKAGNLYVSESYISSEKKLILEMAERAEKKQKEMEEAIFSLWFDTQDLTTLEHKLPPDIRLDFKVKGQRWREWVKQNIYLKEKCATP